MQIATIDKPKESERKSKWDPLDLCEEDLLFTGEKRSSGESEAHNIVYQASLATLIVFKPEFKFVARRKLAREFISHPGLAQKLHYGTLRSSAIATESLYLLFAPPPGQPLPTKIDSAALPSILYDLLEAV